MRVAVFTGSNMGATKRFGEAADAFGRDLARRGVGIVYGGGHVGLMGTLADAALASGGEVIGIIPRFLLEREVGHGDVTRLEIVETMHERKARMGELADAFVALPGGLGTLEELFEVWTWQQLGLHAKPIGLVDIDGCWQPVLSALDHLVDLGFVAPDHRGALIVAKDAGELLAALGDWRRPVTARPAPGPRFAGRPPI